VFHYPRPRGVAEAEFSTIPATLLNFAEFRSKRFSAIPKPTSAISALEISNCVEIVSLK
jgi:hypothetical protein